MTWLIDKMLSGTDAWSREAQRVWDQATRLGLALDEAELALLDVRDLQALRAALDNWHSTLTRLRCMKLLGIVADACWIGRGRLPLSDQAPDTAPETK